MAHIDFQDNLFMGRGTFEERHIFRDVLGKGQGFTFSKEYRCWVTGDVHMAQAVTGVVWTDRAQARLNTLLEAAKISEALSWRSDTNYIPPSPPGLSYLPYQRAGIEYALMRKDTLIADQPGLGKAQPLDAPVLTPTGWRRIGDLVAGDQIMHPSGNAQTVNAVHDRGVMPIFDVKFSDGTIVKCSEDHLWTVRRAQYRYKTVSLKALIKRASDLKGGFQQARFNIPMTEPLVFNAQDHLIHPYVMGVLLGDGSIGRNSITLGCGDYEVVDEVRRLLPETMEIVSRGERHPFHFGFRATVRSKRPNDFNLETNKLGLAGLDSFSKFIPDCYLYDSVDNRRALLRGLLDTDGSISKIGGIRFTSNSPHLIEGVKFLVESLGGMARHHSYINSNGTPHHYLTVRLPSRETPFLIPRKAARFAPSAARGHARYIESVTPAGECAVRCISVASADGLYLTNGCVVTHNTIQAIGVLNADENINTALFVVPASLKVNWYREIDKWMVPNLTFGIAEATRVEKVPDGVYKTGKKKGQTKYRTVETPDYWPDTDVVIINYDVLQRFSAQIKERNWDLLVCDECHALKSAGTGRTLFVLGGKQEFNKAQREKRKAEGLSTRPVWHSAVEAGRRVFLSGTPMMSRPIELWPIAHAFNPSDLGRDYVDFAYRYCNAWTTAYGLDVSGSSNLEELGKKARASFMVRRLKREVLPELPPKIRSVVTLDSPEIRELVAREDELSQALRLYEQVTLNKGVVADEIVQGDQIIDHMARVGMDEGFDPDHPNWRALNLDYAASVAGLEPPAVAILFEEMAKVRRDLGLAKLSALTPWVNDFLEGGEKLLMFAYHSDVVKAIAAATERWNPAVIWGGTPLHRRQGEVDRLQNDESCRLFIGNIQAAGVGFTMTRAHDVAFAELDWVPSQVEQCEDRACRIGQTSAKINSYFLVANGSLDARIAQAAKAKEENIGLAMGA